MSPDGLDDGAVEEEDHNHWDEVAEEESKKDIALVVPVISEIIVRAGKEHAFCCVSTPDSHKRRQGDTNGIAPDSQKNGKSL